MGDKVITSIVTVLTAIVGVAIVAVLVSQHSATANVISAGASGFSSILKTALTPVLGGSGSFGSLGGGGSLQLPSFGGGGSNGGSNPLEDVTSSISFDSF